MSQFLTILCSLPVVAIATYFLPYIAVLLLIARNYIYKGKKQYRASIGLIILGVIVVIPRIVKLILNAINFDSSQIPFFNDVVNSEIYTNQFMTFSKNAITFGVIFLVVGLIHSKISEVIKRVISGFGEAELRKDRQIQEKNDLIMKEKQERAKNNRTVTCPKCGATAMISETGEKCKFCRTSLK